MVANLVETMKSIDLYLDFKCKKNSIFYTRRVLDTFADRIGSGTWQTVITEEGLRAVKKLLSQTATKILQ
jgi:hypothetical protein